MSEDTTAAVFAERKAVAVNKAESALARAELRLAAALREYDREVEVHEERGDGFFSTAYLLARREAVRARKFFEAKESALNTARAERDAARIGEL